MLEGYEYLIVSYFNLKPLMDSKEKADALIEMQDVSQGKEE